jgi:hypothetical protein
MEMKKIVLVCKVLFLLCRVIFSGYATQSHDTSDEIIYNPVFNLFESTPPINKPFTIAMNLPGEYKIKAVKLTIKVTRKITAQNDPEHYKKVVQYDWKYNNLGELANAAATDTDSTGSDNAGMKKYEIRIPIRLDESLKPWFSEFFMFRFEWRLHFEPESYLLDYLNLDTQLKAIYAEGKKIQQKGGSTPGGKTSSQFITDEIVALFQKNLVNNSIELLPGTGGTSRTEEQEAVDLKAIITDYLNNNSDYIKKFVKWLGPVDDDASSHGAKKDDKQLTALISLLLDHLNLKIKVLVLKTDVNLSNYDYKERQKKRIQIGVGLMYPFVSQDYLLPCLNYEVKFIPGAKNRPLYSMGYFNGMLRSFAIEFGISAERENMVNEEAAMKGVYESLFFHVGMGVIILDPIRISGGLFLYNSTLEDGTVDLDFTPYVSISIDIDVFNWLAELYTNNKKYLGGSL